MVIFKMLYKNPLEQKNQYFRMLNSTVLQVQHRPEQIPISENRRDSGSMRNPVASASQDSV